jgi:hypothetical protein
MSAATPCEAGRFDTRRGPRRVLFGQMYEDVGIERAAFAPGARVFCIASAGDTAMALSLAHDVTAIDINPLQLDYAQARVNGAPAVTGAAEGIMGLGRRAMALFGWRRAVVERFLALDDVDAQREYWRAHLDTLGFRLAIDTLLSVSGLKAVYGSPFLAILPSRWSAVMPRTSSSIARRRRSQRSRCRTSSTAPLHRIGSACLPPSAELPRPAPP